jgi:hypothetical protein
MIRIIKCEDGRKLQYVKLGDIKIDFRPWYKVDGDMKVLESDYVQYYSSFSGKKLPLIHTILPWSMLWSKTTIAFVIGLLLGFML